MASFEHTQIVNEIRRIDEVPAEQDRFAVWIKAGDHLDFLRRNARAGELVIYGSGEYTFIHSVALPRAVLPALGDEKLLHWPSLPI